MSHIFVKISNYDMKVVVGHTDSSTCHHLFYCGSWGHVGTFLLILFISLAIIVTVYFMYWRFVDTHFHSLVRSWQCHSLAPWNVTMSFSRWVCWWLCPRVRESVILWFILNIYLVFTLFPAQNSKNSWNFVNEKSTKDVFCYLIEVTFGSTKSGSWLPREPTL